MALSSSNTITGAAGVDLQTVRAELPALAHSIYLNTGGLGPAPRAATAEAARLLHLIGEYGNDTPSVQQELTAGATYARAALGAMFGVPAGDIALIRAVSEGISAVGHGLDWRHGDEVIVTDQEHPAGLFPWLSLRDRFGARVRRLPVHDDAHRPQDAGTLLDRLDSLLTARTRLVALSHVTTETGVRLPAREICALVHRRCPEAAVGFDGAQAAGQFPIDLAAMGCDFYTATGYKWLLGHRGTSFLYIRPDWGDRIRPSWSGPGAAARADRDTLAWEPLPGAARFEFGGRDWFIYAALGKALDFVASAGLRAIEAHAAALADRLKAALAAIPGATVYTPPDAAASSGIVTAGLAGWTGRGLIDALRRRWQITGRSAYRDRAVRFSVAFFTSGAEVETVAAAMRDLAGAPMPSRR
jgi:selenocysteine lyase/cysteine desulfurase